MIAEELIYDILEIKNALEDDSDISEEWILNKIAMYRAIFISQDYFINSSIRPSWTQRLRKQKVIKTNSADDPSIPLTSIQVGKCTLPKIVSLPDDAGVVRLSGSSGINSFDQTDFDVLMLKIAFNEDKMGSFGYFARIGDDAFFWPLPGEIQGIIIAENPMDVQVLGSDGALRDMLVTDEYPLDMELAQKICLEILTKDMNINAQSVSDIVNDSQSQLKILQSGSNQKQGSDS